MNASDGVVGAVEAVSDEVLERVRSRLDERGLDAVLLTSPENVTYGSGAAPPSQRRVASRLAAAILPRVGDTELVVVGVEEEVAREESRLDRVTPYEEFEEHPIDVMAASLRRLGVEDGAIGVEEAHLAVGDARRLRDALPRARLESVDLLMAELRAIKTAGEIELLAATGAAADRAARRAAELAAPGITERELGNLVADQFVAAGGDAIAMMVVGSGPRSAEVNAPPTTRSIERGDVVRLDVIGLKSHYYSDVARTAIVGEAEAEAIRVYDRLYDVHERLLASLGPGVRSTDVYATYQTAMEEAGLPTYHFVGHGLGIGLHEAPFIGARQPTELEEGMVLCIEPIALLPGRFGVQIEDQVAITADGCRPLSRAGGAIVIGG